MRIAFLLQRIVLDLDRIAIVGFQYQKPAIFEITEMLETTAYK